MPENTESNMAEREAHRAGKRNIIAAGFVSLLTDCASEMTYALLPSFLTVSLGVGKEFVGVIEGIAESTASLLKGVSGWFSDRLGKRKPLIVGGYGISNLSKPLLYFATSGLHVLLLRFADRVGKGVRTAARDALVSESAPPGRAGRAFGLHRALDQCGAIIGPAAGFILITVGLTCRQLFLAAAVPGAIAVLLAIFVLRETGSRKEKTALAQTAPKILTHQFKMLLTSVVIFTLGNASNMFLILRAQDLGIAAKYHLLLWGLFNAVYAFTAYPLGRLSDRIGRLRIITYGFLFYSAVYLTFAVATSAFHIWILFAVYGLYHGATDGVMRAYVSDLAAREMKATAYGIYHTAVGLCAFFASVIFGMLYQFLGAKVAFTTGALFSLAAIFPLLLSAYRGNRSRAQA
jgi:MFS family permease